MENTNFCLEDVNPMCMDDPWDEEVDDDFEDINLFDDDFEEDWDDFPDEDFDLDDWDEFGW